MTVRALYLSVLGFCGLFSLHGCEMPVQETNADPSDEVVEEWEANGHDKSKCMKKCTQKEVEEGMNECEKEGQIVYMSGCCAEEDDALCEAGYTVEMPKGEEYCFKVEGAGMGVTAYFYACLPEGGAAATPAP